MTTIHAALAIVTKANGFPGLGFKSAAKIAGIPRSAMRYAKLAHDLHMAPAVCCGVISDQRVVGILRALPVGACKAVCRVESRLHRHLSRERAARLVAAFRRQGDRDENF
jgi:hypothetical protein